MKFNFNLPQKSILGFKVLSSVQSSISCYILLVIGKSLNPYFGLSQMQLITGYLFNIILNLSIVVLIINLIAKKNQIKKTSFVLLNLFLLLYFPISLYEIFLNIRLLFFYLIKVYF